MWKRPRLATGKLERRQRRQEDELARRHGSGAVDFQIIGTTPLSLIGLLSDYTLSQDFVFHFEYMCTVGVYPNSRVYPNWILAGNLISLFSKFGISLWLANTLIPQHNIWLGDCIDPEANFERKILRQLGESDKSFKTAELVFCHVIPGAAAVQIQTDSEEQHALAGGSGG